MSETTSFESSNKIKELVSFINEQEEILVNAKRFKNMYDSNDFQELIIDGLLVDESSFISKSLVGDPNLSREDEESLINKLRGLRFLNEYIGNMSASSRIITNRINEARAEIALIQTEQFSKN